MKISKIKIKLFVWVLLLVAIVVGAGGEDVDTGPCEVAFFRCLQDPLWYGTSTEGLIHCALGYAFCKK